MATINPGSDCAWLGKICRRLKKNDPDFIDLKVDPGRQGLRRFRPIEDMVMFADSLRKNTTVSSLCLKRISLCRQGAMTLAPALKNSKNIKHLELDECDNHDEGNDDHCILDALTTALFYNKSISTFQVTGGNLMNSSAALNSSYGSLSFLVGAANHLAELRICHCFMTVAAATAIAAGLKNSACSVEVLDLTGNGLNDDAIHELSLGLQANSSVKFLSLDFNSFGDNGVEALSKHVLTKMTSAKNKSINSCNISNIRELHLFGNRITPTGAEHLATALTANVTLQSLILSFNQVGDRGCEALGQALTINTTLTKIWFPSNSVGSTGLLSFANHLPNMQGLKELNVGLVLDDYAVDALADALKQNLHLSVLHMEKMDDFLTESEEGFEIGNITMSSGAVGSKHVMDFYLSLNRSGRRLLRNNSVPLWPNILARAETPDVLYYMLRTRPDLLDCSAR